MDQNQRKKKKKENKVQRTLLSIIPFCIVIVDLNKIEQQKRNILMYTVNSANQQTRFITFKSVIRLLFWFFMFCCRCWFVLHAFIHLFIWLLLVCSLMVFIYLFNYYYYAITNCIYGDSMSKGSTYQHVVIQLLLTVFFPYGWSRPCCIYIDKCCFAWI